MLKKLAQEGGSQHSFTIFSLAHTFKNNSGKSLDRPGGSKQFAYNLRSLSYCGIIQASEFYSSIGVDKYTNIENPGWWRRFPKPTLSTWARDWTPELSNIPAVVVAVTEHQAKFNTSKLDFPLQKKRIHILSPMCCWRKKYLCNQRSKQSSATR